MSKGLKIGIIVGVLILLIGTGAYLVGRKPKSSSSQSEKVNTNTSQEQQQTNTSTDESKSDTSLFSLARSGKAQKCSFSYAGEGGKGVGTMYSDGTGLGLMKMTMQTDQGNMGESSTLAVADKVYSWTTTNGQSFGMVMDRKALENPQSPSPSTTPSSESFDKVNQSFSLDCQSWVVDDSLFETPSNVNFTSLPPSN